MSIAHDHFHLFFQWKWLAWLFCSFFAFLTHFRPKYIQHNFRYWSHCLLSERWNAYRKVISLCYNVSRLFIMNVFLFVFLKYNTIICHEKQTIQVLNDAFFFLLKSLLPNECEILEWNIWFLHELGWKVCRFRPFFSS